jgi:hypothetical protein
MTTATTEESRQALLNMLQLDLEIRSGISWDECPGLSFIYEMDDGWHLIEIPVPEAVWNPEPAASLMSIARGMEVVSLQLEDLMSQLTDAKPPEWRGAGFFSESWTVEQEPGPDGQADEVLLEMQKARMLSIHPSRQEAKCWWVMLSDDTFISAVLHRDGTGHAKIFPDPSQHAGRIPDALTIIVKTIARG